MDGLVEKLAAIVGRENVVDNASTLERYSKDGSFAAPMKPRLVVKVKSADEVQGIVKLANETGTPLVPVSSTGPGQRGDAVPSVPEAVIVDLSGMKRILSVNRQQRMAVVEPGVTYGELNAALAKEGLEFSMPLAPKAGKSVVASVLDLEPRLNALHQWNFLDPLRCTEVVWGDGNRMYTGEAGGGPLDIEKQQGSERWQVSALGPMMLDFYRLLTGSQGSMGIVTWASLKCEVASPVHAMHLVPASKVEDLIDFVYRVIKLRLGNEMLILNRAALAALVGGDASDMPAWVALVGVSGQSLLPEQRAQAQTLDISDIAQQLGLKLLPSLPGLSGDTVYSKVTGTGETSGWKNKAKGSYAELFFTTTLDRFPEFNAKMNELAAEAGYPLSDIGVYVNPQNMGTSYHCEFILPYDGACASETARAKKLFVQASETFAGMGAYYLRPHGIWSRLQLNKDAQSTMILQRMKGIFDPKNIMNTGKLGLQGE
ncbi:MAG: FAD-binding oxidoreductase [Rectinemataceae bacterium]|nr:FAD-binding oxidoreductase [Rectinemataceae bacterium]